MAFVNEYASDEDIEKYDLNGIWDKYHPLRKGRYYLGNRPDWTIDRDQNVFLMAIEQGRQEHGNRTTFLLWWDGAHIVANLDLIKGSSGNFDEVPFRIVWALVSMKEPEGFTGRREETVSVLKEALTIYGYWGAQKQIPNTVVEFDF